MEGTYLFNTQTHNVLLVTQLVGISYCRNTTRTYDEEVVIVHGQGRSYEPFKVVVLNGTVQKDTNCSYIIPNTLYN